jgi:hypothetical protein
MNDRLVSIWKEAVVPYLNAHIMHLLEDSEIKV